MVCSMVTRLFKRVFKTCAFVCYLEITIDNFDYFIFVCIRFRIFKCRLTLIICRIKHNILFTCSFHNNDVIDIN